MHRTERPTTRRAVAAGLLAVALAVTGSACAEDSGSSAPGAIKVGLLASLSGTYQAVGTDIRDGFELYLDTHGGKLGGHPVDLIVADEGDGAPTAVPAATKLLKKDRVHVLTGIVGGGSVAAVYPLLVEAKIPFVGRQRPARAQGRLPGLAHVLPVQGDRRGHRPVRAGQRGRHRVRDRPGLPGRLGPARRLHRRLRQGRR